MQLKVSFPGKYPWRAQGDCCLPSPGGADEPLQGHSPLPGNGFITLDSALLKQCSPTALWHAQKQKVADLQTSVLQTRHLGFACANALGCENLVVRHQDHICND